MVLNQSKETLTQGAEEVMVKISELPKHGIKVSEDFVAKYGDKLIGESQIINKGFIQKTAVEQQNTLKQLMGLTVDVSNKSYERVKKGAVLLADTMKASDLEHVKDGKIAEGLIETLSETTETIQDSDTTRKIKAGVASLGEKTKAGVKKIKEGGFLIGLEKAAKSGGILGFFAGLFLSLMKLFGYNEKISELGKIKDKAKEALNPEQIKETKTKVKTYISSTFGETLTDENKEKLSQSLDNLSQEQILQLSEKLKKGELSLSDISSIIPNIWNEFLKEEQIENIQQDIQAKMVESIKKDIAEKYTIELSDEKIEQLGLLVKNNTQISDETIGTFIEINKKQQVLVKDVFGPMCEGIINSTAIFIGLLTKQIIPISAFGIDFAKSGAEVIKISASAIGITKAVNVEMFHKSIENLTPEEKALMVGLLYRKGGLFLSIIGNISESISRIGIESLTNTQVKTTSLVGASLSSNYAKQIENFKKIASSLGVDDKSSIVLKTAQTNLNRIKENYKILNILEEAKGKTGRAVELLKIAGIDNFPDSKLPFNEFVKVFKDSISSTLTDSFSIGKLTSKMGFGAEADLFRLNKKLETISKAQRRMFDGNFITKNIGKLRELMNIGDISRLGDRMVLHFESVDQARKGVSKLNILANKFPDIIKGTLDKLPLIAVAGIAANSEEPFFEELQKELKYLFPIVGPVMLVKDSGIDWSTGKPKVINAVDVGIGGALLTLDGIFLIKEFKGGIVKGMSYMIKPITDIYSLGRGGAEGLYSIGKAVNNGKSFSGILKNAVSKTKFIKKPKLRTIAILVGLGYLGLEAAFAEDNLESIFGKDGKMNKEQLKAEISKLSDEDKEICFRYLLIESVGEENIKDIVFSIKNNQLSIVSNNENIQGDWIIDNKIIELLELSPNISFKYEKKAT